MTIADYLTVLRLVLVPFFLVTFLKGEFMTAFFLFAVAGGTDLIDGTVARLLKKPSELGAYLDPIADKALMVTTVTCLLLAQIIPLWFFLLVVARDSAILTGLAWCRFKRIKIEMQPVMSSKIGTLSNIILVVCGFLTFLKPTLRFLTYPFSFWFTVFLWTSTGLVIISTIQYTYKGCRVLTKKPPYGQSVL